MRPVRIQRVSRLFIPSLRLVRERKGAGWVGMVIGHRTLVFTVFFTLKIFVNLVNHWFVRDLLDVLKGLDVIVRTKWMHVGTNLDASLLRVW